jgi:diketogulonate reductase-like aldo/keto reductase
MGENGVRQAMKAFDKLKLPTYEEDIELITCVSSPTRVEWFLRLYRALITKDHNINIKLPKEVPLSETLNINIPTISLGTMGIGKRVAKDVVSSLVSAGITSIDTAPTYKNEENIGEALSTINEIFCIGKVPKSAVKSEHVRSELESSLKKLQRKNVDLLLLHWPCDVIAAGSLATIWREMEQCLSDGLCKALGVCNFNIDALATLLRNCSIKPVVNQVERHPLLPQWDMIDFCERNDIYVQAHTPLCQGKDDLFANSVIEKIANETTMSPAQVAIQWNLQHGCLVTPKCSSKKHARELLSCTNLSPVQMKALDSMARGKRFVAPPFMYGNFGFCWGITRPSKQW